MDEQQHNDPQKKPYPLRNPIGLAGFLLFIISLSGVTLISGETGVNIMYLALIASVILCTVGLFKKPRLLPALGCLGCLCIGAFIALILLAVGQHRPPQDEPPLEDTTQAYLDSTVVAESVPGDSLAQK